MESHTANEIGDNRWAGYLRKKLFWRVKKRNITRRCLNVCQL